MPLKDYYKTLEITPVATALQVKKSFRQLALRHHPDKNPGNMVAEAMFREIQEAYEVLSNPQKREEYNYKRWYSRSINEKFADEPLTATAIEIECDRLLNYLQTVNAMRINFDGLSGHIRELLSDTNIGILQQYNNETINARVIEKLIQPASLLPFKYIAPIASRLLHIAGGNTTAVEQVGLFVQRQKQKDYWQKYRAPAVLLVTGLLCWVIYWLSK